MRQRSLSFPNYSQACAIELTDSVILTGGSGYDSSRRVQEYNLQGSVASLPDLNTDTNTNTDEFSGRWHHACGHYVHQGEIVSTEEELAYTIQYFHC